LDWRIARSRTRWKRRQPGAGAGGDPRRRIRTVGRQFRRPDSPDAIERLFQPFYRVAIQRSPGLGLGLYIASEIARAHGGTLGVDSSPDETRFHVSDADGLMVEIAFPSAQFA
jgi:hypothetical protein